MFVPEKDTASSSLFQTDVRRRTNLSTATNALRSAAVEAQNDSLGLSSEERLAETEDELNRIVDRDVETLVEGMEEIVDLSSVGSVDKLRALQDSLAIELRTETLVRSCTSLMALSHSMKMLWLLGDEANRRRIQDARTVPLNVEISKLKSRAAQLIEELKAGPSADSSDHQMNLHPSPASPPPSPNAGPSNPSNPSNPT